MGSNHHNEEVFKQKRIPKGPFKFDIQLDDNQKTIIEKLQKNKISLIVADPGCGKTTISLYHALTKLRKKDVERIIITKPIVEVGSSLGFLPGSVTEKAEQYLDSYYYTIDKIVGKMEREKLFRDEKIIFKPIQFIRGNNFDDALIVFDEAQGCTLHELISFTTRMSDSSSMVVLTDPYQSDIKNSGIHQYLKIMGGLTDVEIIYLDDTFQKRSPLIQEIYNRYKKFLDKKYGTSLLK